MPQGRLMLYHDACKGTLNECCCRTSTSRWEEKPMTRKSISRRQFLAKSAAASAGLLPAPFGRPARAATKSVIYILPGMLGSELWLADPNQRLWIDFEQIGAGGL